MTANTCVHTCSYHCERPECIRAQRDELRDRMESALAQRPAAVPVRVTWGEFWIEQGDWETANDYAAFEKAERWLLAQQPAEPVKHKRYAQGTALGEFGIIPMCDQVDE